jgi:hypothetical protein
MPEFTQAIPVIATDAPVARHRRPCIVPALHEPGDLDVPPVARAVGPEAYRRQVDAMATDLYPARQIEQARDRERRLAALIADAQRDGATTPEAIAAHLTRMGVAVRV